MDNTVTVNINDLTQEERNQLISKSKKKRKFRAMTNAEFCKKWQVKHNNRCNEMTELCPLFFTEGCEYSNKPYINANGKYILIEVKE